jgi:hypothetical protein
LQDHYAAATAIDINTSWFAGIFLLSVCLNQKTSITNDIFPDHIPIAGACVAAPCSKRLK